MLKVGDRVKWNGKTLSYVEEELGQTENTVEMPEWLDTIMVGRVFTTDSYNYPIGVYFISENQEDFFREEELELVNES